MVEGVNPGGGSYDFVGLESPSGPGPPSSVIQAGLIDTLVRETFGGRGGVARNGGETKQRGCCREAPRVLRGGSTKREKMLEVMAVDKLRRGIRKC